MIRIILVRTATAAIDIAAIGIFGTMICLVFCSVVGEVGIRHNNIVSSISRRDTNRTAIDGHHGIVKCMTVLTATIDRTLDFGATGRNSCDIITSFFSSRSRRTSSAYRDVGIVNPGRVIVALFWLVDIASRRAEHHAVLLTVYTDGTVVNGDRSNAGARRFEFFDSRDLFNSNRLIIFSDLFLLRFIIKITHRTIGTATIYIMVYTSAFATDGHVGITINMAATHSVVITAAAAIDITHLSATKVSCPYFIFTNRSTADGHISISHNGRCSIISRQCLSENNRVCRCGQYFRLTNGSHLTTAIDAGLHLTTGHGDFSTALHTSCNIFWVSVIVRGSAISRIRTSRVIKFFRKTTIAATKDATKGVLRNVYIIDLICYLRSDGTTTNDNLRAYGLTVSRSVITSLNHTKLTAAIDVALDGAAGDGQRGSLDITQFPPVKR